MEFEIENDLLRGVSLGYGETEVIIPDGVTTIGFRAFAGCSQITSVTIPDSVTRISFMAFMCCTALTKLYLPDSVTDIDNGAFMLCDNLVTNRSTKQWERRYCLEKVDYALNYMRQYKSGDPFFDDVKAENDKFIISQREKLIRKMTANDSAAVTYIMRETRLSVDDIDYLLELFSKNIEITAMLLDHKRKNYTDEYLQRLEIDRFEKEVGIKERSLSEWRKIYLLAEDTGQGGYALKKYMGTNPDVIIPNHIVNKPVTRIGRHCYSPNSTLGCEAIPIKSVYIPDTVTCIELRAFEGCSLLTEITIPNSVVSIERYAFSYCRNLTKVTLPESLSAISDGLFSGCQSLDHIQIPKSVTHIGKEAFSSCTKLTEIDIPDSVEEIGYRAFADCSALHEITIPASVTFIDNASFNNTNDLIITAPRGSYAIEYAKEKGFKFKELPI